MPVLEEIDPRPYYDVNLHTNERTLEDDHERRYKEVQQFETHPYSLMQLAYDEYSE